MTIELRETAGGVILPVKAQPARGAPRWPAFTMGC